MDNIQTNASAPFFRLHETSQKLMLNRLIALWIVLIPSLFIFGFRTVILAVMGVAGSVVTEVIWQFMSKKAQTVSDLSAVVTGLGCACLLPASAPVWMPLVSAAFGTAAAKLAFGGLGRSPFNAAAVGTCFTFLIFCENISLMNITAYSDYEHEMWSRLPDKLFYYAPTDASLPVIENFPFENTPFFEALDVPSQLRAGMDPRLTFGELFVGGFPGALGAVCAVAIIIAAAWLVIRRGIAWRASLGFVAALCVMSLFWRYEHIFLPMCPVYDLLACGSVFVAVFLIGDPLTAPKMRTGQVLYGAAAGVLAIIFRRIGTVGCSDIFAVILINVAANPIDRLVWYCRSHGISYTATKRRIAGRIREKFSKEDDDDVIAV